MRSLSILGSLLLVCVAAACGSVATTPADAHTPDAPPAAGCGNGVCDPTETCMGCASDCGACCGNGGCQPALGEDCMTCASDCGSCPPGCGDGTCNGSESCATCPSDCGDCPPFCGDGACNGAETCSTCTVDCGVCPAVCGNSLCEAGEDCMTCSADCGPCPPACGDGACDLAGGETCTNCPGDCGPCPPMCGDGACNGSETCSSCSIDCGACPPVCGDGSCNGTETCMTCPGDCGLCPPTCGDPTVCESGETCATCMECCMVPTCPNGACDTGESCMSCPADCCTSCGNLRLWYQFEETGGATTVYDSSGCENDGTASSSVTRAQPGRVGNSYLFNTATMISAYVQVPDDPTLSGMGQLTVEAWVNHTGTSFESIVSHGNAMGGDPYIFHTYSSSNVAFTLGNHPSCTGMGSYDSGAAGVIASSSWHHVAVTNNAVAGGSVLLYYDGNLVSSWATSTTSGAICDNGEELIVGAINTTGGWPWEGNIDELKIWNVVRTASQICTDAGGTVMGGVCAL